MSRIFLERMLGEIAPEQMGMNWRGFDLGAFSRTKRLWDHQQKALQNALLALWKYNEDPNLKEAERKQKYFQWYLDYELEADLDFPLDRSSAAKRKLTKLLENYYASENDRLPFEQFINRMGFWMATGSGKTLVIVKLIELLHTLMERGEIPARELLVLAHRDDLLEQFRAHVEEFNRGGGLFIRLYELRDYAEARRQAPTLLAGQEVTVFYYRSDNLSDERKEKIIDFRSYDNEGKWYILLDEAHKGDKDDSKRQYLYSILSRNGFLFNFSATFTDARDIATTAANFNLSEFIRQGYGKHIAILKQEVRAFKKGDEYSDTEKQKIVLKALIMLAYEHKIGEKVRGKSRGVYHRPLLMTLVNSVNTEDADLKMFFRELVKIGDGKTDADTWASAKRELLTELRDKPDFLFEQDSKVRVDLQILNTLTKADLIQQVFNATAPGEIEVLVRSDNNQEVAFKLKTSDKPFALIRIGNRVDWMKQELLGFEINQHFKDERYFDKLNETDSDINILLGSRSFYEGWDSNRPNVIMYVNIGTSEEAKKFILQSVGRGVRIEPLKNKRKRLRELLAGNSLGEEERKTLEAIKSEVQPLESVFIFGTNREALNLVISELDQEDNQAGEKEICLSRNEEAIQDHLLLIPTYTVSENLLYQERSLAKFALTRDNLGLLEDYLHYVSDDRVLFALHNISPVQIKALRDSMKSPGEAYRTDNPRPYRNLAVLVNQAAGYFNLRNKTLAGFKELEEEINHYRHIKVSIEKVGELEVLIDKVMHAGEILRDARAKYDAGQLSLDGLMEQTKRAGKDESGIYYADNIELEIKRIANHYYIPVLVSKDQQIDYIRSVIKVESEVRFMHKLEEYLGKEDNRFKDFDWWVFSKVDEVMDQVAIPYYYPMENRIANFKPDFVFWLAKGNVYHILFVDPKGTGRSEYEHKIDGYKALFEENGRPKKIPYQGLEVKVHVSLFTADSAIPAEGYRKYWFDNIESVLEKVA